jgi:hypothetical protein
VQMLHMQMWEVSRTNAFNIIYNFTFLGGYILTKHLLKYCTERPIHPSTNIYTFIELWACSLVFHLMFFSFFLEFVLLVKENLWL